MMLPAPELRATKWLLKPIQNVGPEEGAELRQSLQRRLESIVTSAVMTLSISALISFHYRQPMLLCWTAADAALVIVRVPVVCYLIKTVNQVDKGWECRPWVVDLVIVLGTLWSAVLGFGSLICVLTNDPGLSILAGLLATGTIGAQGVRSPGSPRLNILQMCLVIIPYGIGILFTAIPMASWAAALIPMYLFGMISITLQLHDDYVKLISGRIENRKRALHCPLTDLPNRTFFSEDLASAFRTVDAGGKAFAVMYLDLDGFKAVNDGLGHGAGDKLLRQVADRLRTWKHPDAFAARLGGDEFAVIIHDDLDDIEAAVCRLIDSLSRPYDLGMDGIARVGASIGLAMSSTSADVGSVLIRADQALYAAKRAGKGTFRWCNVAESRGQPPSKVRLHAGERRMSAVRDDVIAASGTTSAAKRA